MAKGAFKDLDVMLELLRDDFMHYCWILFTKTIVGMLDGIQAFDDVLNRLTDTAEKKQWLD